MKTKPTPIDKPTRRTIETLLREMLNFGDRDCPLYSRYLALREKVDESEKRLLANPAHRRLKAAMARAYSSYDRKRKVIRERASEVRREYLAKGLTKAVLRKIQALVKA